MALEFYLDEVHGNKKLYVDAHDTEGDKCMFVTVIDEEFKTQHDFNGFSLEDLKELAICINHKIGFGLFNLENINNELKSEIDFNNSDKH